MAVMVAMLMLVLLACRRARGRPGQRAGRATTVAERVGRLRAGGGQRGLNGGTLVAMPCTRRRVK